MRYLFWAIGGWVGLPNCFSSCVAIRSAAAAILSNANTIRSSRSATFSTRFGSFMAGILSPGPEKNNLSLYGALAGGKQ